MEIRAWKIWRKFSSSGRIFMQQIHLTWSAESFRKNSCIQANLLFTNVLVEKSCTVSKQPRSVINQGGLSGLVTHRFIPPAIDSLLCLGQRQRQVTSERLCTKNSSGRISVSTLEPPDARFQRVCALLALFSKKEFYPLHGSRFLRTKTLFYRQLHLSRIQANIPSYLFA